MTLNWTTILIAVIGLLGGTGGIYSAFTISATRRKMVADAAAVQATTTTMLGGFAVDVLLKPLRERITELEGEVERLRNKVRVADEREDEIARLKRRLREHEEELAELRRTVATLRGGGAIITDPEAEPPSVPA